MDRRLARVARHEHHRQVGAQLPRLLRQRRPLQRAGHHDVGHHQVDIRHPLQQRPGRVAALGLGHPVAEGPQLPPQHPAHGGIVLHQQDVLAARQPARVRRPLRRHRLAAGREIELHRRAHPRLGVDARGAADLAHQPVHHRQPHARALAHRLRRVERLEGARGLFRGHADARVRHRQQHVAPGRDLLCALLQVVGIDAHIRRLQRQLAPLRHGVMGVHRQVQQGVLHLRPVHLRVPQAPAQHRLDLDRGGQHPAQHPVALGDHRVQVVHPRMQDRAPPIGQQLLGQAAGPAHGGAQFRQAERLLLRVGLGVEQVQVALQHRQRVVEIMGDAPHQRAQRLQPQGARERLLHLVLARGVQRHAPHQRRPRGRVAQPEGGVEHVMPLAGAGGEEPVARDRAPVLQDLPVAGDQLLQRLGVEQVVGARAQEGLHIGAGDLRRHRVAIEEVALRVLDVDRRRRVVEEGAEQRLAPADLRAQVCDLADLGDEADQPGRAGPAILQPEAMPAIEPRAAIRRDQPVFARIGRAMGDRVPQDRAEMLPVLRVDQGDHVLQVELVARGIAQRIEQARRPAHQVGARVPVELPVAMRLQHPEIVVGGDAGQAEAGQRVPRAAVIPAAPVAHARTRPPSLRSRPPGAGPRAHFGPCSLRL